MTDILNLAVAGLSEIETLYLIRCLLQTYASKYEPGLRPLPRMLPLPLLSTTCSYLDHILLQNPPETEIKTPVVRSLGTSFFNILFSLIVAWVSRVGVSFAACRYLFSQIFLQFECGLCQVSQLQPHSRASRVQDNGPL